MGTGMERGSIEVSQQVHAYAQYTHNIYINKQANVHVHVHWHGRRLVQGEESDAVGHLEREREREWVGGSLRSIS